MEHPGRRIAAILVALAATALATAAAVLDGSVEPYVDFSSLALPVVAAAAFAAGGGVAGFFGHRATAAVMVVGSVAASAPALGIGLAQTTTAWTAIAALGTFVSAAAAWLALAHPPERLVGLPSRSVAVAAIAVSAAQMLWRAFAGDPGAWGWCRCAPNPLALPLGPEVYQVVDEWGAIAPAAVLCAVAVVLVARLARGGRRPALLDLLMAVAAALLAACRIIAAVSTVGGHGAGGTALGLVTDVATAAVPAIVIASMLWSRSAHARAAMLHLEGENYRLTDQLEDTLAEVRASRARIVSAADEARRRIEQDLHDGAQQSLVSARISLGVAADTAATASHEQLVGLLDDTQQQLSRALTELRELARGITPAALAHGTLADAVRELAVRAPIPTRVSVSGSQEPSEIVRTTVYFVVSEALANVAKHSGASVAEVSLQLGDTTDVTISDDGAGGASLGGGMGLRGLSDRAAAIGGELAVESAAGRGTTIRLRAPAGGADG